MKKIILSIFAICIFAGASFAATAQDAHNFFNYYVSSANSYNPVITTMYSPSARIIRQIIRPDGSIVTKQTDTARYISEMKKSQSIAKIRRYKNSYSNISVQPLGNNTFKVLALRQPSGESYKLKTYMIVKQINGKWQITEEMMQTKVQMLINAK